MTKSTATDGLSREALLDRLARAEARNRMFEDILACVPGFAWEAVGMPGDPEQKYTFVSAQIEALLGYGIDEWSTTPNFWLTVLHPEDRTRIQTRLQSTTPLFLARDELRFVTKDGRQVWVESHPVTVKDDAGKPIGVRGVVIDITARKEAERAQQALLEKAQRLGQQLDGLISSVPGAVWASWGREDPTRMQTNFVSDQIEVMTGYTPEEWRSTPSFWLKVIHPDDRARVEKHDEDLFTKGGGIRQTRWITKDGRTIWVESHQRIMRDERGAPAGVCGVTIEVTARKEMEEAQAAARLREEMIRAHEATLSELSTPLIPISDEVVVMPLIGGLDGERAERVIQALLDGISRTRARVAILDITGVPSVNSSVADALLRAAKAVRLLGAEAVLTGIRPEVAQTLITLGADLSGIVTRGSLESGIAYAMTRR